MKMHQADANRLVMLCETLTTGGAETFVLRLAAAMQVRGHAVRLAVLRGDKIEWDLVASIAPLVPVDAYRPLGLRNILRLDGLLQRLGVDFSWLRWLQQRWLSQLLARHSVGLVHSHLITSDLVAAQACGQAGIPWLTTMHGDYLAFERTAGSRDARIPDFPRAIALIERSVGAMVCITHDQQDQLNRLMPMTAARNAIHKIYNGYPRPVARLQTDAATAGLLARIPEGALVIGMVARGIRDKGWDVLLEAWRKAALPDAWLLLVGDGPRIAELRQTVNDPSVVFVGNVTNPLDYIARFDIACLPSRFPTESLPTAIIEYLQQGKPVIATHVGEIPVMLGVGSEQPAGITIALADEGAMAGEMCRALLALGTDPRLRARMSRAALESFEPFDMTLCAARYEALYAEVTSVR